MKTYNEMAECVFQRRSEYIVKQQEERKRRAKNIKIVVGVCLVVLFLGNVSLYAITEKTLLTLFFSEADEEQLDFMWERMVEDLKTTETITDVSLGMKNGIEIAYWKDGLCTKATESVISESGG